MNLTKVFFSIFLFCGGLLWSQPKVDFISCEATVKLNTIEKAISGGIIYTFEVTKMVDTIRIDAKNMQFENVTINHKLVQSKTTTTQLLLFEGFKKGKNTLTFSYSAQPKQTLYFIGEGEQLQIWTQGQGKYTSHWLPSFDDVNEKVIFNVTVGYQKDFQVVSNGKLDKVVAVATDMYYWYYTMKQPMSSYLVMLAIGKFDKQVDTTKSGTPLEFYLDRSDKDKFEPTFRYSKPMFDYLETEIGVKYPWEVYRQIPIRDFLYAGMENTTSTLFSQDFVVDKVGFHDKTYMNVNAHELAHQWFGNLITAKSGKHHWLQEGFATYYALLAEKAVLGEDYFQWKLYEMAERLQQVSKTDTVPILNANASTLSFYQKGAWALHSLRNEMGEKLFRKAVKNYLKKHQYQSVETEDFLKEVRKVSKIDTDKFRKEWLESSTFPVKESIALLKKNPFMETYFELIDTQKDSIETKIDKLEELLKKHAYYPIQEEIIYQLAESSYEQKKTLLKKAMADNDLKVRQAIARIMVEIPDDFLADYESLLDDDSYITQEIALGTLWKLKPEKRFKYLNQSKEWVGFNDNNLRILWLTLALMTENYEMENKVHFYDELMGYSTSKYESAIRQNALTNLLFLNPNDQNILRNLVEATVHHKWQFTLYARNTIRDLLKTERHKTYFETMLPTLPEKEKAQLQRLLKP